MKETSLTIEQIENLLVGFVNSPFYIRQHIVVPNVDWGFLNHEADLLVLSRAGYLTEVEIKRTWADFMKDFKKSHTHYDKKLSWFYYAVPASIANRVFDWLYVGEYNDSLWYKSKVFELTQNNPHGCGLIVYNDPSEYYPHGKTKITVDPKRMGAYKVSQEEEIKLLRLCGMRVWNLKKKVSELQTKLKQKTT